MKKNTILVTALTGLAAFVGFTALATPTIVSPADYATISTMSASLKAFKDTSAMVTYTTYKSSTSGNATRTGYAADYATNSAPVKLVWSGTSGSCAVKIWRTHKDTAATPVVSTNVTGTSFLFYDPEVGRNYTWTVQNGSATATGHFFTERDAPRILYTSHDGFHICNGRDQGGWTTSSGKVVKQGLVYRSREFEFYAPHNEAESEFYPIPYLRDTLGIRLDVDLRAKQTVIDAYMPGYPTAWNSISLSPIAPTVPRYHSEDDCGTSFPSYSEAVTVKANRIAVWHTFAKFCDSSNFPILYHCSHGKDRTGTLGYILLGVLGVSRDDLNRDYGLSWYAYSTWTLSSWTIDNVYNSLNSRYSSASTLADKCEAYLKECASDAGVAATTAQNMIDTYKTLMLEDPETNDGTDAFAYTDFYFRRAGGGGSFGSEDSSGRLNYMFK
ncbi:MAG: tyrosine-protein phosphatase, partial [Kiritimatiellae bacterium]|nr:tyrosine-protein phosphatase [Kiritimatiellia bacterium]